MKFRHRAIGGYFSRCKGVRYTIYYNYGKGFKISMLNPTKEDENERFFNSGLFDMYFDSLENAADYCEQINAGKIDYVKMNLEYKAKAEKAKQEQLDACKENADEFIKNCEMFGITIGDFFTLLKAYRDLPDESNQFLPD